MNNETLARIDADYNCTADLNPRVQARWYPTGLRLKYEPVYDPALKFVSSMGRAYYLEAVYTALEESGQHDTAVKWYCLNQHFYHPIAIADIFEIIGTQEPFCQEDVWGCDSE